MMTSSGRSLPVSLHRMRTPHLLVLLFCYLLGFPGELHTPFYAQSLPYLYATTPAILVLWSSCGWPGATKACTARCHDYQLGVVLQKVAKRQVVCISAFVTRSMYVACSKGRSPMLGTSRLAGALHCPSLHITRPKTLSRWVFP